MNTYIIIGITVLVSYLCFNNQGLFYRLALIPFRAVRYKEWYRVFSYGMVHADWTHLLVNMITLWSFGVYIERAFRQIGLGTIDYWGLYLGGLVFAIIPDLIKQRNNPNYISVGASGAVCAVLFTSILLNPWNKILFFGVLPIPGIIFGVLYLIYCQYMGKRGGDSINHNAHFFGAIYGLIYPLLLEPRILNMFLSHF